MSTSTNCNKKWQVLTIPFIFKLRLAARLEDLEESAVTTRALVPNA